MRSSKVEIDMTEGHIFKKIISFSLPLVITGLLQCFYNAADLIVVGIMKGIRHWRQLIEDRKNTAI